MAKKVSKNARVGDRAKNAGSGKDFIKVVQSIKNANGSYSYKPVMVHKDKVKEFMANNK